MPRSHCGRRGAGFRRGAEPPSVTALILGWITQHGGQPSVARLHKQPARRQWIFLDLKLEKKIIHQPFFKIPWTIFALLKINLNKQQQFPAREKRKAKMLLHLKVTTIQQSQRKSKRFLL